jgi:hypothetical protein
MIIDWKTLYAPRISSERTTRYDQEVIANGHLPKLRGLQVFRCKCSGGWNRQIQETSGGWPLKEQVTASTKTGKVGTPRKRHVSRTERMRSTQRSPLSL